jgi:hypothetical protein
MSKRMAGIITAYGVVLAALTLIGRSLAPEDQYVLFGGLIAGVLSSACGIAIWMGRKRRVWIVTSVVFSLFLLTQVPGAWIESAEKGAGLGKGSDVFDALAELWDLPLFRAWRATVRILPTRSDNPQPRRIVPTHPQ